jgi:arabinofuranosyltransferase
MAWLLLDAWRRKRPWLPAAFRLAAPFLAITALHYLGRRAYYGEWLPNTYYAKAVRSWVEAGVHYFTAASIENGLYLLVPLSLLGGWAVWRRSNDAVHLLSAALILPHAAYLLVIGGDHFEYRPLDFWWPLIAAGAAAGVAEAAIGVSRRAEDTGIVLRRAGAAALLVLALVYGNAMGFASHLITRDLTARSETFSINPQLTPERSPLLFRIPGMSLLAPVYNASLTFCIDHAVGRRQVEHKALWTYRKQLWGAYENVARRGVVPGGLVMAMGVVGIAPYHLPDVEFIDVLGLTDKVIARTPVDKPNEERRMAHDRQPPKGYLESRGVNVRIRPASRTLDEALSFAPNAIALAPDLWMPFRVERAHLLAGPMAKQEIHTKTGVRIGLAPTSSDTESPGPDDPGPAPPPL